MRRTCYIFIFQKEDENPNTFKTVNLSPVLTLPIETPLTHHSLSLQSSLSKINIYLLLQKNSVCHLDTTLKRIYHY